MIPSRQQSTVLPSIDSLDEKIKSEHQRSASHLESSSRSILSPQSSIHQPLPSLSAQGRSPLDRRQASPPNGDKHDANLTPRPPSTKPHRQSLPSLHEALLNPRNSSQDIIYSARPTDSASPAHTRDSFIQSQASHSVQAGSTDPKTSQSSYIQAQSSFSDSASSSRQGPQIPPLSTGASTSPQSHITSQYRPFSSHYSYGSSPSTQSALPQPSPIQHHHSMPPPPPPTASTTAAATASAATIAPGASFPRSTSNHFNSKSGAQTEYVPQRYSESIKRHLEGYDIDQGLLEVTQNSKQLMNFSEYYNQKAHQSQRSGPMQPLPELQEIDAMLRHAEALKNGLTRLRVAVVEQKTAHAEQSSSQLPPNSHRHIDVETAQEDRPGSVNHVFPLSDTKKRRGRAAPPGRCHSCNRAETPEWRRGPDGARTLCNACGLHYAKLTRKAGGSGGGSSGGSTVNKPTSGMSTLQPKTSTIQP